MNWITKFNFVIICYVYTEYIELIFNFNEIMSQIEPYIIFVSNHQYKLDDSLIFAQLKQLSLFVFNKLYFYSIN